MKTLPEYAYIMTFLGTFAGVFLLSNVVARLKGYRE